MERKLKPSGLVAGLTPQSLAGSKSRTHVQTFWHSAGAGGLALGDTHLGITEFSWSASKSFYIVTKLVSKMTKQMQMHRCFTDPHAVRLPGYRHKRATEAKANDTKRAKPQVRLGRAGTGTTGSRDRTSGPNLFCRTLEFGTATTF